MKEQDIKLTFQETEHLCRLYMDCKLSVLEETELRYLLTEIDYNSPLIDEVRKVMVIDSYISEKPYIKREISRKAMSRKWPVYLSIAACAAILIGISFPRPLPHGSIDSQSYYIAYTDGHRLSDKDAKLRIETEKRAADDFIKEMSELEASKQLMINNFLNP